VARYDTVFILGAGASYDLDGSFPLGTTLAELIENALAVEIANRGNGSEDYVAHAIMTRGGGLGSPHWEAMRRIVDGICGAASIDQFVDEWSDKPLVAEVAKLSIASQLMKAEGDSRLCGLNFRMVGNANILRSYRNSWLGTIVSKAGAGVPRRNFQQCLERIAFITFNYDRSLEWYLAHYLQTTQDVPEEEAVAFVRAMPIKHVYGSLGDPFGQDYQAYGAAPMGSAFYAAKGIKTYSEEIHSEDAAEIAEIVKDSREIVFLGCALHAQNMGILFPGGPPMCKTYASTLGMRQRKLHEIRSYFDNAYGVGAFVANDASCGDMMNAIWDEIFT
jgi:hypothetical protein